jgi:hypothetical protein
MVPPSMVPLKYGFPPSISSYQVYISPGIMLIKYKTS